MEGQLAVLADKEQPVLGTIPFAGVATARAGLTGVVGIHADAAAACERCFVGQQPAQLGKGPLGGMPIRLARFGGHGNQLLAEASALAPPRPLANAREVFQADETPGMGVQDVLGNGVIGAQLEPSLSRSDGDASPGRRASAFALEPFLQTSIVISFRSHLLSGRELGVVLWRGHRRQIALPHIDAYHLRHVGWCGVRGHDGERDQEIEAVFGPIIPEFGPANRCPVLEPGKMPGIALIGQDESPREGQHTHPPCGFEGVVTPQDIRERRRDIVWRLVQALEAFPGPAGFACFHVLVPLGPQGFVGGSHLSEDTARHLRRQAMPGASLFVEIVMQALAVGGLPMRKGMLAGLIERVTIGQLREPQLSHLFRRRHQFEFGRQGGLHALPFFFSTIQSERRAVLPPTPEARGYPHRLTHDHLHLLATINGFGLHLAARDEKSESISHLQAELEAMPSFRQKTETVYQLPTSKDSGLVSSLRLNSTFVREGSDASASQTDTWCAIRGTRTSDNCPVLAQHAEQERSLDRNACTRQRSSLPEPPSRHLGRCDRASRMSAMLVASRPHLSAVPIARLQ